MFGAWFESRLEQAWRSRNEENILFYGVGKACGSDVWLQW